MLLYLKKLVVLEKWGSRSSRKKRNSKSSEDVTPKKKTKPQSTSRNLPELDAPGKFVVYF